MKKAGDALILQFADMLVGKHVDSDILKQCLSVICKNFNFDCGLIYEIDQHNRFNAKEYHAIQDTQLCDNFAIDDINAELRSRIADEPISYFNEGVQCSPSEREFLQILLAQSAILISIVDKNSRIFGFIVLKNSLVKEVFQDSELKTLSILLNMLSKYVAIRMYQNKLSFAQTSLESILDNTGIDIYVNDFLTHEVLYANKSMVAPYGGTANFVGNKCWQMLFPGQSGPCIFCPQHKIIDEQGNPTGVYTWDYQRPFDGSWFRVFSAAFRWIDGRLAHVVSSANITDNKRNEELIRYMASYDSLTKLPNRRMLISECERRIDHAQEGDKGYLLFFDIDGFKAINDTFGHDAGDEFLVKLGEFFSAIPLLKDAIYRNGGDEFVALIDGNVSDSNIRNLAGFIHERFKEPWKLKKGEIYCNTSIGVAAYPKDGSTAEELLLKADQAMYQIKKSGGADICFA